MMDVYPYNSVMTYADAVVIAKIAHINQVRKYSGLPYLTHSLNVASSFTGEKLKILAVVHDVLEDTAVTMKELIRMGLPEELIIPLECLTHNPADSYFTYIMKVNANPLAKVIKIADLTDNLTDLKEGSLKTKYQFAKYILENND